MYLAGAFYWTFPWRNWSHKTLVYYPKKIFSSEFYLYQSLNGARSTSIFKENFHKGKLLKETLWDRASDNDNLFLYLQTGICRPSNSRNYNYGFGFFNSRQSTHEPCYYNYYEWDCKTQRVKDCSIEMAIDTCTTKSVVKIPVKKFIDTDKNCEDSSQDDCIHVRYHDCEEVPFMSKYISRKKFTFLKLFHSSKKNPFRF